MSRQKPCQFQQPNPQPLPRQSGLKIVFPCRLSLCQYKATSDRFSQVLIEFGITLKPITGSARLGQAELLDGSPVKIDS